VVALGLIQEEELILLQELDKVQVDLEIVQDQDKELAKV
jgi:hypothetical protein